MRQLLTAAVPEIVLTLLHLAALAPSLKHLVCSVLLEKYISVLLS